MAWSAADELGEAGWLTSLILDLADDEDWGPALKGGWANARRPDREYLPYTHGVIEKHLAGGIHAGL